MKKVGLFVIIAVAFLAACSKNGFHIVGSIKDLPDSAHLFLYDSQTRKNIDSAIVKDTKFEFTGSVAAISQYYLIYEPIDGERNYLSVWVDNQKITINGKVDNFENAEIKGTDVQKQQSELNALLAPIENRIDSIYNVYSEEDTALANKLNNLYDKLLLQESEIQSNYVENHPDYFYSAFVLNRLIRELDVEKGQKLYNSLSENLKSSTYALGIKKYLELNKNLKIGDKFADLSLTGADGQLVSLSSVANGKYTLIDFWASWCNPCRKENPNLRKAYKTYKDKGFEIYGVSLDKNVQDWKQAIAEDSISWVTVIDTNAFDSEAAMMYSVRYIPHNFLLNANGEILAIDLRGEDLELKLMEAIK
jgi:thiol-disulfide isomerase/thioredoxin